MSFQFIEFKDKTVRKLPLVSLIQDKTVTPTRKLPASKTSGGSIVVLISYKQPVFHFDDERNKRLIQLQSLEYVSNITLQDFRKEQQAFYSMREQLKKEYPDKYVAIHGGHVVDSDIDESALIDRFFNKFGNVPVYIDKPEKKRLIKMRSPRLIK